MSLVNLLLNNEIILFANAFKCPFEERKKDCALTEIADKPAVEIYKAVQDLNDKTKVIMSKACQDCQSECSAKLFTIEVN